MRDLFKLAQRLDTVILFANCTPEFKGLYTEIAGQPIIILNENETDQNKRLEYLAHELAHRILHKGLTGKYGANRATFEEQANRLANQLLGTGQHHNQMYK